MASPTPATPAAAWAAGTTPDAADAATPDAGPASGVEPSPQPSAPAAAEAPPQGQQHAVRPLPTPRHGPVRRLRGEGRP